MIKLHEIEELCKTVNRAAIKALLRNAAIMKDPNMSPEMRAQAEANVKAISYNKPIPQEPKPKKIKAAASEQAIQPAQTSLTQTPVAAAAPSPQGPIGNIKLKYSPAYQHYGVTEEMWNQAPHAQQDLFNHHNEVMAGKHPGLMHIKSAVDASRPKMLKSIDSLYELFSQLKKHL